MKMNPIIMDLMERIVLRQQDLKSGMIWTVGILGSSFASLMRILMTCETLTLINLF